MFLKSTDFDPLNSSVRLDPPFLLLLHVWSSIHTISSQLLFVMEKNISNETSRFVFSNGIIFGWCEDEFSNLRNVGVSRSFRVIQRPLNIYLLRWAEIVSYFMIFNVDLDLSQYLLTYSVPKWLFFPKKTFFLRDILFLKKSGVSGRTHCSP